MRRKTVLPVLSLAALLWACGGGGGPALSDVLSDPGAADLPAGDGEPGGDLPGDRDLPATDPAPGDAADDPGTADPGPPDPGTGDLAGDPSPADPGPSDPGTGDLPPADPGAVDPGTVPAPLPPDGPGPWATFSRTAKVTRGDREIRVDGHAPLREGSESFPVVVFLPGFQADISRYTQTAERLASHGFVVVRAQLPGGLLDVSHRAMAQDVPAVLDWALDPAGPLGGYADGSRVGTTGHSLGGKVAVMAAGLDPRVKAVFAVDPVNGGNPLTGYSEDLPDIVPDGVAPLALPLGFPGEDWSADHKAFLSPSCAPADQNFRTFYEAATASPWRAMWALDGADHQDFVDNPSDCGTFCAVCPDGPGDDDRQLEAVRTLMAAFFRRHLGGEAAMEDWLTGAKVPAEAVATHAP